MAYTNRYDGPDLTPEEQDLAAALRDYSDRPEDGASGATWVPTEVLRRLYMHWRGWHRWRYDPEAPARLTKRQFGRAVVRVFPNAARRRRRASGRLQWGYAHLIGPDAMHSRRTTDTDRMTKTGEPGP